MSETAYQKLAKKSWVFCRTVRIDRADNAPYLWRFILLRCPWLSVYLHVFLGDDEPCHHDHPWPFWSFILWGGYWEFVPLGQLGPFAHPREIGRWYWPGSLLRRPAKWRHRIERGRWTPVTLVITGRKQRSWGFYTPGGWVPWRQYSSKVHCN